MKKAIVSFSGDPITVGHINIIERALKIFDHVTVAIGENIAKKYTFSLDKRKELAKKALYVYGEKVEVCSFDGLLVDFAYSKCIDTIVRGVRGSNDVDYEKILHDINHSQKLGIETFILFADQNLSHISSSAVKELQRLHAKNMLDYVPMVVKKELESTISKQYLLGITGEIGAGKSYISALFMKYAKLLRINVFNIDFDILGHKILEEATEPVFIDIRNKLIDKFGKTIKTNNNFINKKILGNLLWNDPTSLEWFNKVMRNGLDYLYRELLKKYTCIDKSLILVNGALLSEFRMTNLTNNNIVVIQASKECRIQRLLNRDYSKEETDKRMSSQLSHGNKIKIIEEEIKKYNYGRYFVIDNSDGINTDMQNIFNQIMLYLGIVTGDRI